MVAQLRKGRQLQLPVNIMIHLFDTLVKSIRLYGSEIWAHEGTLVPKSDVKQQFATTTTAL